MSVIYDHIYWRNSPFHRGSFTGGDSDKKRKRALEKFAEIFGAKRETIEGDEDSFRIIFQYKGHNFVYEDIEEKSINGNPIRKGILRLLPLMFTSTLTFNERDLGDQG